MGSAFMLYYGIKLKKKVLIIIIYNLLKEGRIVILELKL